MVHIYSNVCQALFCASATSFLRPAGAPGNKRSAGPADSCAHGDLPLPGLAAREARAGLASMALSPQVFPASWSAFYHKPKASFRREALKLFQSLLISFILLYCFRLNLAEYSARIRRKPPPKIGGERRSNQAEVCNASARCLRRSTPTPASRFQPSNP